MCIFIVDSESKQSAAISLGSWSPVQHREYLTVRAEDFEDAGLLCVRPITSRLLRGYS